MPLYIEKINGDVDRQGEYRAICLFQKLENRKKAEICNFPLTVLALAQKDHWKWYLSEQLFSYHKRDKRPIWSSKLPCRPGPWPWLGETGSSVRPREQVAYRWWRWWCILYRSGLRKYSYVVSAAPLIFFDTVIVVFPLSLWPPLSLGTTWIDNNWTLA